MAAGAYNMMRKVVFVVIPLLFNYKAVLAQSFPSILEGYSIIAERVEDLPDENPPFRQHWHERIYFGHGGHIFTKQSLESGNPRNAGSFAVMSGQSNGWKTPFEWNGAGVSREWTNPNNGVVLTLSISIALAQGRPSCDIALLRQGFQRRVLVVEKSCRVVKGNIVAD